MFHDCITDLRADPRTKTGLIAFCATDRNLMYPDRETHRSDEEVDAYLTASDVPRSFSGLLVCDREDNEILKRARSNDRQVWKPAIVNIGTSAFQLSRLRPKARVYIYGVNSTPLNRNWSDPQVIDQWRLENAHLHLLVHVADGGAPAPYLQGPDLTQWKAMIPHVCLGQQFVPMLMGTYHNVLASPELRGKRIPKEVIVPAAEYMVKHSRKQMYWGYLEDGRNEHNDAVLANWDLVKDI